jgi:hypothetical protein
VTDAAQSLLAIIECRDSAVARPDALGRGNRHCATRARAPAETADKHALLQAEAEEAFLYILVTYRTDSSVGQRVPVSIELGRFTAAALQLDDRGARSNPPKTGMQNIECPLNWAVSWRGIVDG